METKREMIAALSAVMHYIRSEDDARSGSSQSPAAPLNVWGLSGRQAQMQTRNLMQMKAFHGLRLR